LIQGLAEASQLTGEQLSAYLQREGVKLADFERRRLALEQDGTESAATTKLILTAIAAALVRT
jgi:hypothetical protein